MYRQSESSCGFAICCMAETLRMHWKPHLKCSELITKAASLFGAARCGCLRVEEQHHHLSLKVLQADAFSIVRLELPAALQRTTSVILGHSNFAAMRISRQYILVLTT